MTDEPTHPQKLAPEEVASRVAAILAAAERDAREIIAAARRDVPAAEAPPTAAGASSAPSDEGEALSASNGAGAIGELARTLESLSARVDTLEATTGARLDVLWDALSAGRGAPAESLVSSRGAVGAGGLLGEPEQARTQAPPPAPTALTGDRADPAGLARAARVRAVDLALRGYTRAQIATELSSTMAPAAVEQLLGEVLEVS
jgi:hypothetical protein